MGKNPTRGEKDMFQNNYFKNRDSIPGLKIQDSAGSIRGFFFDQTVPVFKLRIQYKEPYKYRYSNVGYRGQQDHQTYTEDPNK